MIIEEINSEGRFFSDLDGIYRYKFHDNIKELYCDIINALKEANIIQ